MDRVNLAAARQTATWLDAESGGFDDFLRLVSRQEVKADWPHAESLERNVPIYDGATVGRAAGDPSARRELMAEWVAAFDGGPGVIVIRGAVADGSIVDRATEVFEAIIADQHARHAGGGDHFAKPGANDRIWNALEKHCLADPANFARYYGAPALAMAAEAWLGPGYQMTAQVNRVNPGGAAQTAHRDYHLGFMAPAEITRYPAHVHRLSPALTLQGAVAHCAMPVETGPTLFLPYSQRFLEGYIAFARPEFQDHFARHHVQLPLEKGDAVFFNPALMHGAGTNRSADIYRTANLLQVSSAFGRAMEVVNRGRMALALYPALAAALAAGEISRTDAGHAIAAAAEGYAFPTNLDRDPPVGGLAPKSQAALMGEALDKGESPDDFAAAIAAQAARREA